MTLTGNPPTASLPEEVSRARQIVVEFGWNSTSYQILNPGIKLWFASGSRAVVGYTRRSGMLVAAGAPVCSADSLASVCDEFEAFARQQKHAVCYVCAEDRIRTALARTGRHTSIALGAQPVWNPHSWPSLIQERSSLRAQLHRAANKGVVVEPVTAAYAAADEEIHSILRQWIAARHLPPLHFLVEPNVLGGVLTDRIVLAARQQARPVAFLVASPIRAKAGYLVELLARSPHAPNGSSELLIDSAMRHFAAEGCRYATLGLVALAHAAGQDIQKNPAWLRTLMYFARAHANRFYNFRGLEHFRLKMHPDRWETVYVVSNERRFSARTLYAAGAAFSGISPLIAIAIGLRKAAAAEFRTVFRR